MTCFAQVKERGAELMQSAGRRLRAGALDQAKGGAARRPLVQVKDATGKAVDAAGKAATDASKKAQDLLPQIVRSVPQIPLPGFLPIEVVCGSPRPAAHDILCAVEGRILSRRKIPRPGPAAGGCRRAGGARYSGDPPSCVGQDRMALLGVWEFRRLATCCSMPRAATKTVGASNPFETWNRVRPVSVRGRIVAQGVNRFRRSESPCSSSAGRRIGATPLPLVEFAVLERHLRSVRSSGLWRCNRSGRVPWIIRRPKRWRTGTRSFCTSTVGSRCIP